MQFGFVYPGGDARDAAACAAAAEAAGWDGFFVWDAVWGVDPWVSLAAAALRTERLRLGTMLTPPSRRRPWKLAAETATLDRLSNGRVILSVGLGAVDSGFVDFGEVTDRRTRAELLDESLAILTGLWAGQPFAFEGQHYHVQPTKFMAPPPPVQQPRIPLWVVGAWPRPKSMQRAARYDGLLPNVLDADGNPTEISPETLSAMRAYARAHGAAEHYDIVVEGATVPGDTAALDRIRALAAAGATWWLEALWTLAGEGVYTAATQARILDRVRAGPPRLA
jgi:alkanesulfonate monooxygenase SsuD/methylene tetrahydromethanopterin reductase-like flavin-dependent oxidoreductase (luciferase family)